jgi:hypothetical protein
MMPQDIFHEYTIGASSSSLISFSFSPSSANVMSKMNDEAHSASLYQSNMTHLNSYDPFVLSKQTPSVMFTPNSRAQSVSNRRTRDLSSIYDNIKQSYSYTIDFHGLIAFLQKRFSPQKTLRIAEALASIRSSFISCTKMLNRKDLIFMKKCFQRTLFEYEDFINACDTPTIVCWRTGEVAAVGKEFSLLTGWTKDVLLGNKPNRNVNTGHNFEPGGAVPEATDDARSQPIFLTELLDDDSVIEFYEDFARLAVEDSRDSVTRQCNLLKYKTAVDYAAERDPTRNEMNGPRLSKTNHVDEPVGIHRLGEKDDKVECSYCWIVKRDVFDILTLIVMNVSDASNSSTR